MTVMATHRHYPSPSSSSVDRMGLSFIAPGAPAAPYQQSFASPTRGNTQPPSWSSVNASSLSIRMNYNSSPGRVDSHRGTRRLRHWRPQPSGCLRGTEASVQSGREARCDVSVHHAGEAMEGSCKALQPLEEGPEPWFYRKNMPKDRGSL
ncbi:uncharacterized protein BDZ99DRAFT_92168 [Mytilinidion resinicola]|uniref:Uncharacterized protein n=1 Tax=Mytilinidion resinicola TaxID=574789 RepID=A0A6A6YCH6_9PEZI|nr:uncharacterized protein BDZ99DRAFT_92168 [Mytilinidion resinicola]KAF2806213.1 hypothetical protein BDZ99DRAFT_92168 [Mytilinidion resinicola]